MNIYKDCYAHVEDVIANGLRVARLTKYQRDCHFEFAYLVSEFRNHAGRLGYKLPHSSSKKGLYISTDRLIVDLYVDFISSMQSN